MAEPFLAEIRLMSFNFPPRGWALCNGQLLPINQNQALFALLGTTYGGDGRVNFALPDFRGRTPVHHGIGVGRNFTMGETGGETAHTLTLNELPAHSHPVQATSAPADSVIAAGGRLAAFSGGYGSSQNVTTLAPSMIDARGGGQPHQNMAPYLVMSHCIALQGIFPSQS